MIKINYVKSGSKADRSNLGNAYFNEGKFTEAAGQYKKAVELSPKSTLANNNLADAYANAGNYDLALAAYNETLAIDRANTTAIYGIGAVYVRQSKLDHARMQKTRLDSLDRDAAARLQKKIAAALPR